MMLKDPQSDLDCPGLLGHVSFSMLSTGKWKMKGSVQQEIKCLAEMFNADLNGRFCSQILLKYSAFMNFMRWW